MAQQPQNIDIVWTFQKAVLDANVWHEVSEGRVDWFFRPSLSNNLHSLNDGANTMQNMAPKLPQVWQFLPVDGVPGRYAMRSNHSGPGLQISACYKSDEVTDARTGICLLPSTGEDAQKWDIDFSVSTTTWILRNVHNGSSLVLDCHPGNPIFMNPDFAPSHNPAQHWIIVPGDQVNDQTFSTTYTQLPPGATNLPIPSTTSTLLPPAVPNSSSSQPALSTGVVVAIGIGSALGVLLVGFAIIALFLRYRRNSRAQAKPSPPNGAAQPMTGSYSPIPGKAAASSPLQSAYTPFTPDPVNSSGTSTGYLGSGPAAQELDSRQLPAQLPNSP